MVFRTNTAYDRWWEGRKKWGSFVNDSRNLAIKLSVILEEDVDKRYFQRMIPNFIFSSKENLRKGVNFDELDLSEEEFQELQSKKHVPNAISQLIFKKVVELKKQGAKSMALSHDEVLAGLAEIVNEETGIDTESVKMEKSFTNDLDIDSISMMTIVVNAEEKFSVKIPDEEVKNLLTVGDAVNFITSAQG